MKAYTIALLGVMMSFNTAVNASDTVKCDNPDTQLEINHCAGEAFSQADKQLNQTWKTLLDHFKADQNKINQLRVAQRAWLAFRDAEVEALFPCEDENKRVCWGSMYPTHYNYAMEQLTQARIQTLKTHLDTGEGGEPAITVNEPELLTTLPSFLGMSVGDDLAQHADKLKKSVLETGEGSFDVFEIHQGGRKLGHVSPAGRNESVIGGITITSPLAVTEQGIKVGSTWGELKQALPELEVHGSEIEGRTYAFFGSVAYRLDVYFGAYDIPASEIRKIKDSTRITEIDLR